MCNTEAERGKKDREQEGERKKKIKEVGDRWKNRAMKLRDDRTRRRTIKKKKHVNLAAEVPSGLWLFFVWGLSFECRRTKWKRRRRTWRRGRKEKHRLGHRAQKKTRLVEPQSSKKCNPWSRNDLNTFFPTCCYYCSDTEGSACRLEHLLHLDFYFLKARVRWWIFVCQKGGKKKGKERKKVFFVSFLKLNPIYTYAPVRRAANGNYIPLNALTLSQLSRGRLIRPLVWRGEKMKPGKEKLYFFLTFNKCFQTLKEKIGETDLFFPSAIDKYPSSAHVWQK